MLARGRDRSKALTAATPRGGRRVEPREPGRAKMGAMSEPVSLIGREPELDAFVRAVEGGARLLTITGPGGVGKSRLVTAGLARLAEAQRDVIAIAHARLGEDRTIEALVDHVVDALGGKGARKQDLTRLFARHAPLLLVLDPFDRFVALAGELTRWLAAVPELALVVVSRQRLSIPEEVTLEIAPIADEDTAIALFASFAARHRPGFRLDERDRATVSAIVRRLDGLPLAIELAASRMAVMSPAALLHRLSNRFDVLRRGGAGDARHRTLEASIAWSVELLEPAARDVLAAASVFRGGFTAEAAERVLEGERRDEGAPILDILQSLRERSLLGLSEPRASLEVRLALDQSVRAFVEPSLDPRRRDALEDRHASHYVSWAEASAARASGREASRARQAIAEERENLLAVVERILGRPNVSSRSADRALRALVVLAPILLREGSLELTRDHLERGLSVARGSGADPRLLARAHLLRAELELRGGADERGERVERDLAEALTLAHHSNERSVEGRALLFLARLGAARAEPRARVEEALDRAALLAREADDDALASAALSTRGGILYRSGDLEGARLLFDEGLARARRANDRPGEIAFARRLGLVALARLELEPARALLEGASKLAQEDEDRRAWLTTLVPLALTLALLSRGQDRFGPAIRLLEEALAGASELSLANVESSARALLGVLHAARGQRGEARLLLGEALASDDPTRLPDLDVLALLTLARIEAEANRREAAKRLVVQATARARGLADGALVALLGDDPLALDSPHRSPLVALLLLVPASAISLDSVPPPSHASASLVIGPDALWFRVSEAPRVDLSRRKPLRLILEHLAALERGAHADWSALLEAGWPGERMRPDAGAHRVRVAISTLRKMGLRDVLRTEESGYRLDPAYAVRRSA